MAEERREDDGTRWMTPRYTNPNRTNQLCINPPPPSASVLCRVSMGCSDAVTPAPMLPPSSLPQAALKYVLHQVAFTWQAVPERAWLSMSSEEMVFACAE